MDNEFVTLLIDSIPLNLIELEFKSFGVIYGNKQLKSMNCRLC